MARSRGNRGGKRGGWAASGGANKDKKGKSNGSPTTYKQKAFGKTKLIDRVFRESNVVRDSSGKFTEKPGKGKPPKAKLLDGHRPDDIEKKKFKVIEDVTKSIRQRQKAAKDLEQYRLEVAQQKIDADVNARIEEAANSILTSNDETRKSIKDLIDSAKSEAEINKSYERKKDEYTERQVETYTKGLLDENLSDAEIESRVTRFKQGIMLVQQNNSSMEIRGLLETIQLAEGIQDTPFNILREYREMNESLNKGIGTRAMAMSDAEEAIGEEYLMYQARKARRKALSRVQSGDLDSNVTAARERREAAKKAKEVKKEKTEALAKAEKYGDTNAIKKANEELDRAKQDLKEANKEAKRDKKDTEIHARIYNNIEDVEADAGISLTMTRARTAAPNSNETVANRMSELEEVFGRNTLEALMDNIDVVSIVPQSINKLQSNLIKTLYEFRVKNGTLKEGDKLSWKSLTKDMSPDEIQALVKGWSKKKEIAKYTGASRWQAKKAKEGSIHTSDKRQQQGEKLVNKWREEGEYSRTRKGESTEQVKKIHSHITEGMRKNFKNAVDKGIQEAYTQAESQGTVLTDADKKRIAREAKRTALDNLVGMEELLSEDSDMESYGGRTIVNPATEIPREVIEVLPDGALAYLINKFSNQVGRKVKTSIVYNQFIHGAAEDNVTQENSSRFKYETHHIEQFMHRTESGEPVMIYDSAKKGGKLRNMIHSDMDNLYAEDIDGERVYYIKSQKKNGEEIKSYLGKSPYDDESDVEVAEDGRVQKGGKPSVSRIKEELGTNEPYIDLRGSTHQNKDFLYSMLHPGTTVRNDEDFKSQVKTLDRIAAATGNKEVNKRYKDEVGFHSVGVGEEERKAHEKVKGKLEAIRKQETLGELREELERRRELNPQEIEEAEVLSRYGHATRLRDSEEDNVKTTRNKVEELHRLKAAYNAFGAGGITMTKIDKAIGAATIAAKKAQDRYNDVKNIVEKIERNQQELLDKKYDPKIHSEKFLTEAMYEANTWNISVEGEATRTKLREAIIKRHGQTKKDN